MVSGLLMWDGAGLPLYRQWQASENMGVAWAHLRLAHEAEVGAGAAGILVIAGAADVIRAQADVQAGVQAGLLSAARFVVALRWVHEEPPV